MAVSYTHLFGDTLHAPDGTKPREEVMACVTRVMTHLLANHVKAVVIACNTATAVAAKELRETYIFSCPVILANVFNSSKEQFR